MAEKILIVDDDAETLRLVGLMLQRQGYEVVSAQSGTQAIQMVQSETPNLIVLDIMMPDLDGYTVTERIRSKVEWSDIPILMFTAKNQVDDKVAGYEAGADDYLTKPVHPAELSAHIRALLGRHKTSQASSKPTGYMLGILAAKGGMGVSTIALELALNLYQQAHIDLIASELRPGQGSWGPLLGLTVPDGISALLRQKAGTLVNTDVERHILRSTFGMRMLLSSNRIKDADLLCSTTQILSLLQHLSRLAPFNIVDIGTPFIPAFDQIAGQFHELLVVGEAQPESLSRTRNMIEQLGDLQFGKSKTLNLVVVNRQRSDMQLSVDQVHDKLGIAPITVIPPAPELAHQSALRATPMTLLQPDGLAVRQITNLAQHYAQVVRV